MEEKKSVPFKGTPEQEKALLDVINAGKNEKGALMSIMQKAQDIYGYLPIEVQSIIARELGIPLQEVYGVATFYSQFSLEPKGEHIISICTGTACYVKGAQAGLDATEKELNISCGKTTEDGKFTLEATRCLGCCGLAPVMVIDEEVYGRLTAGQVKGILAKY